MVNAPINPAGMGAVGGGFVPQNLMYPKLMQLIVQTALPAQVGRQVLQHYPTNDQSVTIPIEDGSPVAIASRMGEFDEFPYDVAPVNAKSVSVYKIGRGHPISNEMVRFQQIPLIQHYLIKLGLVMGNTIDRDCWSVISAGVYGGNTVPCSGNSLFFDGAVATIANTIGQEDIIDAMVNVEDSNYIPDTIAVNPIGYGYIRKLPHYSAEFAYGKPGYQTGERGQIEGLRLLVSKNVPAGEAFVLAGGANSTPLGQYSPLGFFVESDPITTMMQPVPNTDGYRVYAKSLYNPVIAALKAAAKLTY